MDYGAYPNMSVRYIHCNSTFYTPGGVPSCNDSNVDKWSHGRCDMSTIVLSVGLHFLLPLLLAVCDIT